VTFLIKLSSKSVCKLIVTGAITIYLYIDCIGLSTYEFVVQQRSDKTNISSIFSGSNRNRLLSYLTYIQTCVGVVVCCTKNRIQPSASNITDPKQTKLSDKKFIKSLINDTSDTQQNIISDENTYQTRLENEIEKSEVITVSNSTTTEPNKEIDFRNQPELQSLRNINRIDEVEENLSKDINNETIAENKSVEEEGQRDLYNSVDEPIFKPLSSVPQSGRMSRLSFVQKNDYGVRTVSPDYGLSSDQLFRHNSYDKLIASNNRLNPLNRNLDQINKNKNKTNLAVVSIDNMKNMSSNAN